MPWKFKITETKSEVSINSGCAAICAHFLTTNCVQILPENEPAIVSAMKEYMSASVEDRVMETNPKAVTHICQLSNVHLNPEIV